ncbi:MAG TPA: hypothetical protein VMT89_03150, partial [Candidatus Acidoferrales bacterium]|nr:hypothetical protein [Candidatus Acidoferrales bacterium]
MKVTWNWLADFVELTLTSGDLADRLDMAGLEVESIEPRGQELAEVRIAEVAAVRPHPQADRLKICDVYTSDALRTVVCGAPNVAEGQRVAYAPPGTKLPNCEITAQEIRGVLSAGMLCSEAELGIGPDETGILVLPTD